MFLASIRNRKWFENSKKTNNARKTYKYIFRGLRVKEPPMNLQKYLKEDFTLAFWIHAYPPFKAEILSTFNCNLNFINP